MSAQTWGNAPGIRFDNSKQALKAQLNPTLTK
jgi:hypothetical protein